MELAAKAAWVITIMEKPASTNVTTNVKKTLVIVALDFAQASVWKASLGVFVTKPVLQTVQKAVLETTMEDALNVELVHMVRSVI